MNQLSGHYAYGDDGKPIRATRGRPPMPLMTDGEFEAVQELLRLAPRVRGSSLGRAALEISLMRGSHTANDPRTRKARTVSARWVGRQLALRGFAGKKDLRAKMGEISRKGYSGRKSLAAAYMGTRIAPVQQSPTIPEQPSDTGNEPSTLGVGSEQPKVL